jgi:hypothetical protein
MISLKADNAVVRRGGRCVNEAVKGAYVCLTVRQLLLG